MTDKTLRKKIEAIKRHQICTQPIVSLADFRALKNSHEIHTVLVVDDDEIMRNGIKRILESEGYNVIAAEDGIALSKILETTRLDLILLDVNLPWIDGFELCRLIKDHHHLKVVPLVMISAGNSAEEVQRGISAGADDYIAKPFDIDTILTTVNRRLLSPLIEDN